MASPIKKRYRYFLYSRDQYALRTKAEASLGKRYIPGKVLVNGRWKEYTEISLTPSNNKYPDAKLVAEGNLEDLRYHLNTSEWKVR